MGKLFDSMKQRGAALPPATSAAVAPRLQVVPAHRELPVVQDHEPMPFYEVPNDDEPRRNLPHPAKTAAPVRVTPSVAQEPKLTLAHPPSPSKLSFSPAVASDRSLFKHLADELVVIHQPSSPASQEYRAIAEQLIQELTTYQAQSLTLLPIQQESSSTLAANLGCAWAEITRLPVALVDAARSRPGDDVACLFGLTNAPGWEELMTGSSLGEALQQTGWAWLDLIGSGRRLAWSNTQSWAEKCSHLIESLGKHYRHIVLLGPAFPLSPLGLVLAETTQCTGLLLAQDEAHQNHRDAVLKTLTAQGRTVVGTIVVDG